jgi:beta-xylosidase
MHRRLRTFLIFIVSLQFAGTGWPQAKPSLATQGRYGDPEIRVFAGQYWIYPTSSGLKSNHQEKENFNPLQQKLRTGHIAYSAYLSQTSLDAFSSSDLVQWTKHSNILDVNSVSWAAYAIWAPSAIHLNGKYYLFFAANDIQRDDKFPGGIGVVVSDKPDGVFVDIIGKPLISEFHNAAQPIDPMVYQDDDGTIYLYYGGQGHCNVARLSADLKSILPMNDGELFKEITPEHYVEGPFMIKRKGVYYLMWSEGDWGNSSYGVAYGKSHSPTGPFDRVGKILQTDPVVAKGPGHNSVLQIPDTDDWYIVYHRHPLNTTRPNDRVMAIDSMYFDSDGNIKPIQMTKHGPGVRTIPRQK